MKKYILAVACSLLLCILCSCESEAVEYIGEISGSYGAGSGNSEYQTTGGALDVSRVVEGHEIDFTADYLYAETDGDPDTEKYELSLFDKHFYSGNTGLYWFEGTEYMQNKFAGIKGQIIVSPGIGFRYSNEWLSANAEGGPSGIYEERTDGTDEGFGLVRAHGDFAIDLTCFELGADAEYQYPLEDEEDYRVDGEVYAELPISDIFSARYSVSGTYLNEIPDGVEERLDTYSLFSVVVSF
jgi:hypothetical protein